MTTHQGGCHCGAVRYEAKGDLSNVIACNCSHCQIKGFALAFIPVADFTLLKGEEALADYHFNKHLIRHRFCKHCGVQPFAFAKSPEGADMAAINVRTVDDYYFDQVTVNPFNGRDL